MVIEATVPLAIQPSESGRIFNMVPGMECVPILASTPRTKGMPLTCSISVVG